MIDEQFPSLLALSVSLRDYSLGTIWWVHEEIWKSVLPPSYSSDRDGHPGLCCRNNPIPPTHPAQRIPLLLGRSKKCSANTAFQVQGITDEEPERTTYFQWKLCGRIPFREFQAERCWPADKAILSPDELSAFRGELQKRGLL
jgi:hypothetical protein